MVSNAYVYALRAGLVHLSLASPVALGPQSYQAGLRGKERDDSTVGNKTGDRTSSA